MSDLTKQSQEERVREAAKEFGGQVDRIDLSRPFDIAGLEVDRIYLREPVAKDFDCWNLAEVEGGGEMALMRQLACQLAHVSPDAFDTLPGVDFMKVVEKLQPFLDIAQ